MQPDATSVWGSLAITNPQGYGFVFIDPVSFQPVTSVNDFAGRTAFNVFGGGAAFFANSGDNTGTDAINAGAQLDSYVPTTLQNAGVVGMVPGHTVSVSRGTRTVPAVSLDTDLAGIFSGFALTGAATLTYKEIAAMKFYVSGASATDPGGKTRWGTKVNAGNYTEWLELDALGQFIPLVASAPGTPLTPSNVRLGKSGFGFGAITLDYTNTATIGAVQINKPTGRVIIGAGTSSVVVTNNLVTANSIVLVTPAQVDAGVRTVLSVVAGAGSFTITVSGNVTANQAYNFLVINTDS